MRVLIALVVTWLAGVAHAESAKRVVLADPDPELHRALAASLSPWRLEILVEHVPPRDLGSARQRALARDARFVVWRSGGDLVIYDRERASLERRDARSGLLDAPAAASAALTVKTLMRLPPPAPVASRGASGAPGARSSSMPLPQTQPPARSPPRPPRTQDALASSERSSGGGARSPAAPRDVAPSSEHSPDGAASGAPASLPRETAPAPPGGRTSRTRQVAAKPPADTLPARSSQADVVSTTTPVRPLRVQAGASSRVVRGSETSFGARFEGAALVRPWRSRDLRVGIAVELGTASAIATTGFKGEWSDASARIVVAWALDRGRWQLEPHVGIGATRSHLVGVETSMTRAELDVFAFASGGVWTRYRFGAFSIGAGLQVVVAPGTPTHMRAESAVEMFRVPAVGVALGLVSAFDLPL